ncbi:hypothetical protein NPIL_162051 [Nephila pilipes]|uniref:Uncharacterized protein n=1 Tax=Nephila pilipes TaxID=299642 RepID=A0A8X6U2X8_NEPPI|nr:hypothetical protein NPIL_162051 [Nephila pilipes]
MVFLFRNNIFELNTSSTGDRNFSSASVYYLATRISSEEESRKAKGAAECKFCLFSSSRVPVYGTDVMCTKGGFRCKRPGLLCHRVLIFHDNLRQHSIRDTRNLLDSWPWEIRPHPPSSPDLARTDFHLFRRCLLSSKKM